MASEGELLAKLERWLAGRREPPGIFDVVDTGDGELLAAYVLKAFRSAAAAAVTDRISREGATLLPPSSESKPRAVMLVFDGLARACSLTDAEQMDLLGLRSLGELRVLRHARTEDLPSLILERIVLLLDISKMISTLLPEPHAAAAWIRKSNNAPLFGGRSALQLMLHEGMPALRSIRVYLQT